MEAAGPAEWTAEDILMLLETMKKSIAVRERDKIWSSGLKVLDWEIVAFQHFSPEECRAKWNEIMQKLRKIKTLTELIADAQNAMEHSDLENQMKRPKKPMSASAFYFAENKDKLKSKKPGLSSRELMKFANDHYRSLSPRDKEKYFLQAEEALKQYRMNMDELRRTQPVKKKRKKAETDKKKKESKKEADSDPIKGKTKKKTHLNGYQLFCQEQSSKMDGIPKYKIPTVWAERWKMLSQEEKDDYSRRRSEKKKKKFFQGEPKLPITSVYKLYCKKKLSEMKGQERSQKESRELLAKLSHEFKNLPQHEIERYQTEINNSLLTYKEELQTWFKKLKPKTQLKYWQSKPTRIKYLENKMSTSHHRTSDSEDEDFDDNSSSDDEELTVIEIDHEIKEEDQLFCDMFDLF